jgi:hypothetical protein
MLLSAASFGTNLQRKLPDVFPKSTTHTVLLILLKYSANQTEFRGRWQVDEICRRQFSTEGIAWLLVEYYRRCLYRFFSVIRMWNLNNHMWFTCGIITCRCSNFTREFSCPVLCTHLNKRDSQWTTEEHLAVIFCWKLLLYHSQKNMSYTHCNWNWIPAQLPSEEHIQNALPSLCSTRLVSSPRFFSINNKPTS